VVCQDTGVYWRTSKVGALIWSDRFTHSVAPHSAIFSRSQIPSLAGRSLLAWEHQAKVMSIHAVLMLMATNLRHHLPKSLGIHWHLSLCNFLIFRIFSHFQDLSSG